jgi:hypothetical protein
MHLQPAADSTVALTVVVLQSPNLNKPALSYDVQVLEHNEHLQQQLQELSNATHLASAPAAPAGPATTAMQVSLLRAALAEANYRLSAAGLLPVAATRLQEVSRSQVCTPWVSAAPSACGDRQLHMAPEALSTTTTQRKGTTMCMQARMQGLAARGIMPACLRTACMLKSFGSCLCCAGLRCVTSLLLSTLSSVVELWWEAWQSSLLDTHTSFASGLP